MDIIRQQNLDFVTRVTISAGLNDEKKGTPETGMTIRFVEPPKEHDPSKRVTFNTNTDPFVLKSGVWYWKKGDNRIGGNGADKKKISGEKLKTAMLEMFQHQCNTYAATFNMYKAKYGAKKK